MDSTQDRGLVFIVDDDAAVRRSLSSVLSASGFEPIMYESAEMFLRQYVDRGPACIICDIRMPGITGLQMLDRLSDRGVSHPVILTTGYGDVETVINCFRSGAADFFEKPVSNTLLLGRVQEAIERDRESRQTEALRRHTLEGIRTLSPRERQVMEMLFAGHPNKAIAHELHLSEKTIAAHRAHILEKMRVDSLPKLVRVLMASRVERELALAA